MIEFLVGSVIILLGAVFFFKRRADDAGKDAILAETKGEDKQLKKKQDEVKSEINKVDEDVKAIMEDRKSNRDKYLTDQERADRWNK